MKQQPRTSYLICTSKGKRAVKRRVQNDVATASVAERTVRSAEIIRGQARTSLSDETTVIEHQFAPASLYSVAPERARKIAAKNRSSMPTGIGGSFQLANSASPLGVIDSASAPTARMRKRGGAPGSDILVRSKTCGRVKRTRPSPKASRRSTAGDAPAPESQEQLQVASRDAACAL